MSDAGFQHTRDLVQAYAEAFNDQPNGGPGYELARDELMDRLSQLHHDAEKARRDYLRPGVRFGFQVGPMRAVTPGEPHTTYVVPLYLTGTGDRYPRFICDVFGDIAVQAAANAAALGTIITDYLQSKVGTRFNIGNARAFLRLFST